jgi:hypothetical protein
MLPFTIDFMCILCVLEKRNKAIKMNDHNAAYVIKNPVEVVL